MGSVELFLQYHQSQQHEKDSSTQKDEHKYWISCTLLGYVHSSDLALFAITSWMSITHPLSTTAPLFYIYFFIFWTYHYRKTLTTNLYLNIIIYYNLWQLLIFSHRFILTYGPNMKTTKKFKTSDLNLYELQQKLKKTLKETLSWIAVTS